MGIEYREDFKLWWPDWDTKTERNHAYILAHLKDMDYAISQCKSWNLCIQAGGHAGLWPRRLMGTFQQVISFEPDPDLYACLAANTGSQGLTNLTIANAALGEVEGTAFLKRSGSSGTNRINEADGFQVDVMTIDSLGLDFCDAIFLDVEHYEFQALLGAQETIKKYRPVIQIEEEKEPGAAHELLLTLGYKYDQKQGKDRVYLA